MNFRSISIAFCTLAVASVASAQTLFHDDWESYRPGTNDVYGNFSFDLLNFDLEAGETRPNVIAGPKDGLTPFSGNQMFDFRASTLGRGRPAIGWRSGAYGDVYPEVNIGVRFAIPVSYATKIKFSIEGIAFAHNGLPVSMGGSFNSVTNEFTGQGVTTAVSLPRGKWNTVLLKIDWKRKFTFTTLNGVLLAKRSFATDPELLRSRVSSVNIGVTPLEIYKDQYPVGDGAPGIFVDDIDVVAVPEPTQLSFVASGLVGTLILRRRRT